MKVSLILLALFGIFVDRDVEAVVPLDVSKLHGLAQPFIQGFTKLSEQSNHMVNSLIDETVAGAYRLIGNSLNDVASKAKQSDAVKAFKKILADKESQLNDVIQSTFKQFNGFLSLLSQNGIFHLDAKVLEQKLSEISLAHHGQVDALIDDMKDNIKDVVTKFDLPRNQLDERIATYFQHHINSIKQVIDTVQSPLRETLSNLMQTLQQNKVPNINGGLSVTLKNMLHKGETSIKGAAMFVKEEITEVAGHSL